jgi:hypothetical protein
VTKRSYKQISHVRGGWADWTPVRKTQTLVLGCCDCGLVHNHKFRIYIPDKKTSTGVRSAGARQAIVMYALQVDGRATGGLRSSARFKGIAAIIKNHKKKRPATKS